PLQGAGSELLFPWPVAASVSNHGASPWHRSHFARFILTTVAASVSNHGASPWHRSHFARFILTTSVSGSALPSADRFVDCQVKWSPSTRVMTLVAASFLPS